MADFAAAFKANKQKYMVSNKPKRRSRGLSPLDAAPAVPSPAPAPAPATLSPIDTSLRPLALEPIIDSPLIGADGKPVPQQQVASSRPAQPRVSVRNTAGRKLSLSASLAQAQAQRRSSSREPSPTPSPTQSRRGSRASPDGSPTSRRQSQADTPKSRRQSQAERRASKASANGNPALLDARRLSSVIAARKARRRSEAVRVMSAAPRGGGNSLLDEWESFESNCSAAFEDPLLEAELKMQRLEQYVAEVAVACNCLDAVLEDPTLGGMGSTVQTLRAVRDTLVRAAYRDLPKRQQRRKRRPTVRHYLDRRLAVEGLFVAEGQLELETSVPRLQERVSALSPGDMQTVVAPACATMFRILPTEQIVGVVRPLLTHRRMAPLVEHMPAAEREFLRSTLAEEEVSLHSDEFLGPALAGSPVALKRELFTNAVADADCAEDRATLMEAAVRAVPLAQRPGVMVTAFRTLESDDARVRVLVEQHGLSPAQSSMAAFAQAFIHLAAEQKQALIETLLQQLRADQLQSVLVELPSALTQNLLHPLIAKMDHDEQMTTARSIAEELSPLAQRRLLADVALLRADDAKGMLDLLKYLLAQLPRERRAQWLLAMDHVPPVDREAILESYLRQAETFERRSVVTAAVNAFEHKDRAEVLRPLFQSLDRSLQDALLPPPPSMQLYPISFSALQSAATALQLALRVAADARLQDERLLPPLDPEGPGARDAPAAQLAVQWLNLQLSGCGDFFAGPGQAPPGATADSRWPCDGWPYLSLGDAVRRTQPKHLAAALFHAAGRPGEALDAQVRAAKPAGRSAADVLLRVAVEVVGVPQSLLVMPDIERQDPNSVFVLLAAAMAAVPGAAAATGDGSAAAALHARLEQAAASVGRLAQRFDTGDTPATDELADAAALVAALQGGAQTTLDGVGDAHRRFRDRALGANFLALDVLQRDALGSDAIVLVAEEDDARLSAFAAVPEAALQGVLHRLRCSAAAELVSAALRPYARDVHDVFVSAAAGGAALSRPQLTRLVRRLGLSPETGFEPALLHGSPLDRLGWDAAAVLVDSEADGDDGDADAGEATEDDDDGDNEEEAPTRRPRHLLTPAEFCICLVHLAAGLVPRGKLVAAAEGPSSIARRGSQAARRGSFVAEALAAIASDAAGDQEDQQQPEAQPEPEEIDDEGAAAGALLAAALEKLLVEYVLPHGQVNGALVADVRRALSAARVRRALDPHLYSLKLLFDKGPAKATPAQRLLRLLEKKRLLDDAVTPKRVAAVAQAMANDVPFEEFCETLAVCGMMRNPNPLEPLEQRVAQFVSLVLVGERRKSSVGSAGSSG